jgi:hypothetical protein
MNWKEILDDIIELNKNFVIVHGYCDITKSNIGFAFKNLNQNSYKTIIGTGYYKNIIECLNDYAFNDADDGVNQDGEYEFKAIMKWYKDDWETEEPGYFDIKHIEVTLIQTLIQKNRNLKLNSLNI